MKKAAVRLFAIGLCVLWQQGAFATVTIQVSAELLKTSAGTAMPSSGLIVLAASTTDSSFGSLTPSAGLSVGSFLTLDDLVLAQWDVTSAHGGADAGNGAFLGQTAALTLLGAGNYANLTAGDSLQLFWFPTLTFGATTVGSGTTYGAYRDGVGLDGSAVWTVPSDGTFQANYFFTSDASTLNGGGSNPTASGNASFSAVPEPSAYAAMAGLACLVFAGVRRRFSKSDASSAI